MVAYKKIPVYVRILLFKSFGFVKAHHLKVHVKFVVKEFFGDKRLTQLCICINNKTVTNISTSLLSAVESETSLI